MKLTCLDCGVEYEKPNYYAEEVEEGTAHFYYYRRSMKYCDVCRRKREIKMLRVLSKVIEAIGNINQEDVE